MRVLLEVHSWLVLLILKGLALKQGMLLIFYILQVILTVLGNASSLIIIPTNLPLRIVLVLVPKLPVLTHDSLRGGRFPLHVLMALKLLMQTHTIRPRCSLFISTCPILHLMLKRLLQHLPVLRVAIFGFSLAIFRVGFLVLGEEWSGVQPRLYDVHTLLILQLVETQGAGP